jgi:hypothetical protein
MGRAAHHGELLKLGRKFWPAWKTFLRNHMAGVAVMDFLVVPTINFRLLSVLVILRHERRHLADFKSEAVAGLDRNGWPASNRNQWPTSSRNRWPASSGISTVGKRPC